MREYRATVGATDGNIIAAIITTQTARNQPSVPRPVHGPSSMPRIWSTVHHQPAAASAKSSGDHPEPGACGGERRGETSVPGTASAPVRSRAQAAQENSDFDKPGLALVGDAEGVDP